MRAVKQVLVLGLVVAELGGQAVAAGAWSHFWLLGVWGRGLAGAVGEGAAHAGAEAGHEVVALATHFHLWLVSVWAWGKQRSSVGPREASRTHGGKGAGSRVLIAGNEVLALVVNVSFRCVGAGPWVSVPCKQCIRSGPRSHRVLHLLSSQRFHRVVSARPRDSRVSLEVAFNVLLFHLFSGNTEGVRAGEGLCAVEVSGSGVGVRGGNASAVLPCEVVLRAVAEASRALFQRRGQVVDKVLTPAWELRALGRLGKALSLGEGVQLLGPGVVGGRLVDLLRGRDNDGHL